jgi:hypothetical protein
VNAIGPQNEYDFSEVKYELSPSTRKKKEFGSTPNTIKVNRATIHDTSDRKKQR